MINENDTTEKTLNDRLAEELNTSNDSVGSPKFDVDEDDDSDYAPRQDGDDGQMKGYRIAIGILTVILVALSLLYFNIHRQQSADYDLLSIDRDSVQHNLTQIINDFDSLEVNNESLKMDMEVEKHRADSVITQLKRERSFNYSKLKQYEREVGTLRTIMRGYLQQIDSLNNLNKQLISENVSFKKKISTVELRAEVAEERAKELDTRVREGGRLRAENISIVALNESGRDVSRVKRAERLSINFTIVPNELATPGNKKIYARVTSPDGYVLTTEALPTFDLNGETITYTASREVDYQNRSLPASIFFAGSGFVEGTYEVELYHSNYLIGSSKMSVK